jgi:hypothetical protein
VIRIVRIPSALLRRFLLIVVRILPDRPGCWLPEVPPMSPRCLSALAVASLLVAGSAAAQLTIPMSSYEQYLRVDPTDTASPALIVPLADHGLAPGTTIRIEAVGEYDNGPGGDVYSPLMAMFSASGTLLGPSLLVRVPDAIEAGTDYVTHTTCPGAYPTDIPQDFTVDAPGVEVTIPAGATHLFLCPRECYSSDNSDPDADFGVRITVVSTGVPPLSGATLALQAPWPNPSGSRCTIGFAVPAPGRVRLTLHGVDGRLVRTLVDGPLLAGTRTAAWDGRDHLGAPVAAGIYFARLATDQGVLTRKLIRAR